MLVEYILSVEEGRSEVTQYADLSSKGWFRFRFVSRFFLHVRFIKIDLIFLRWHFMDLIAYINIPDI